MTKRIIFLCFALVSFSYGQKKELRSANKFIEKGEYASALDILDTTNDLIQASDDKTKARAMFLYGMIYTNTEDFDKAVNSFEMAKNLGGTNPLLDAEISKLENAIITSAIGDQETEDFISSAKKLYGAYKINPENNQLYLFYAASSSVNADDYEQALIYYKMLVDINYEGIETKYYVTEVSSGNEIEIGSESEFNLLKKSKDYQDPREEDTESKYPEIVKNIALIYNTLGQKDKALDAIKSARQSNPDDVGLIITTANIYFELGDKEAFKLSMSEAIELDPSNPILYYNLGVVSADLGEKDVAVEYYKKSIELDPTSENSYLNLVALILDGETSIIEEMNSLGTSRADNVRYDELKELRENLYLQCVPILKQLVDLNQNIEGVRTLMNIFGTLGDNQGYMEMKNLLDQLDQ
ncbi:MAG TPA: tetratricopeptide repeat protein [Flavobacteriaceae bacterium]|jgi:tetratricopeptide (TPR) repeat protein|nr:tetratricopeptide repeat protein [Flavobacteriaceae bacterium]